MHGGIMKWRMQYVQKNKAWLDLLSVEANMKISDPMMMWWKYMKGKVKEIVSEKKKNVTKKIELKLTKDFHSNKKLFWKSVKSTRGRAKTADFNVIQHVYADSKIFK